MQRCVRIVSPFQGAVHPFLPALSSTRVHLCHVPKGWSMKGMVIPVRSAWGAKKVSPDEKWPTIQDLMKQGRRAEAIEEIKAILRDHPAHFYSVITITEMMLQEQKNKEAMDIIDKAIKIVPNETTFLTLRASVLQNQGEMNAALEVLDKVLQISPHSLPTILAKAQILTVQGKFKDSLVLSDSVITSGMALLSGAYFNNSTASYAMQKYEDALKWSTKALAMDRAGRILCAHGLALFALGRVTDALKAYPLFVISIIVLLTKIRFESVPASDPARPLAEQQIDNIRRQTN